MIIEHAASLMVVAGIVCSLLEVQEQRLPDGLRHVSFLEYLDLHLSSSKRVADLVYELCFDEPTYHGAAWILIYFRIVFFFFDYVEGLRWLPTTMILASVRCIYFL